MNIDTLASVFGVHKGETENLAGKGGLNLKLNIVKSRHNHILSSQRPAVHNHPLSLSQLPKHLLQKTAK